MSENNLAKYKFVALKFPRENFVRSSVESNREPDKLKNTGTLPFCGISEKSTQ